MKGVPDPHAPDIQAPGHAAAKEGLVHLRVRRSIMTMINADGASAGDRIPSERVLAETLGASRMTVRKAVDQLVLDGLLLRDSTSGTRIAPIQVVRPINTDRPRGLSRIIDRSGGAPGSRLLAFRIEPADRHVAARLVIVEGEAIVFLRRLRSIDDRPFCVETSYLPAARVKGLVEGDLIGGQSLGTLLKLRYGIALAEVDRLIKVARMPGDDAQLLGLPADTALLVQHSLMRDREGAAVEYTISANHPDRVVFKSDKADPGL
jgi:GntR family transcriptional regulator